MKVLIIGDSVVGGFGRKDRNSFVHQALNKLGYQYVDLSCPGMTTEDFLCVLDNKSKGLCVEQQGALETIESFSDCSMVFISLGNVDGKKNFQPKNPLYKIIPKRYLRNDGKLDERPYYSSKPLKYWFAKLDNYVRRIIKWFLNISGNLDFPVAFESFQFNFNRIINNFNGKEVVLISTSLIDNKYFPHSEEYFKSINEFLRVYAMQHTKVHYFEFTSSICDSMLLLDHFHLSTKGHEHVAKRFESFLNKILV